MPGYIVGPVLAPGELPWPIRWEDDPRIDDGHDHTWETVLLGAVAASKLLPRLRRPRVEEVVRCQICCAPRCGSSTDENPCLERRHHRGDHTRGT